MMHAYSQLKRLLREQQLTVPELERRLQQQGLRINVKSLYRLNNDRQPLQRLDLRVAGAVCQVLALPLSDLIAFEKPRPKLRRLAATKQRRLEALMAGNNEGKLTTSEQRELKELVQEAEQIMLDNARQLAGQRQQLTAR
jgi:hypothetical protein